VYRSLEDLRRSLEALRSQHPDSSGGLAAQLEFLQAAVEDLMTGLPTRPVPSESAASGLAWSLDDDWFAEFEL
jgi:hypothetical protein